MECAQCPSALTRIAFRHNPLTGPATSRRRQEESTLRGEKDFPRVRIFDRGARWKTGHVDVPGIWRERAGNKPRFAGYGSAIRQVSVFLDAARGCFRPPHIPLWRGRGSGRSIRTLRIRSVARWSFVMLITPAGSVWSRSITWMRDGPTYSPEKIAEWPCGCQLRRTQHHSD